MAIASSETEHSSASAAKEESVSYRIKSGPNDKYGIMKLPSKRWAMQPTMDKIVKTGNSCIFLTDNGGSHQLYNVETNTALNYEEVIPYGKYLIVKRDRLYGIIDYDFNILVKCKYDNIKELKEAVIPYCKNGKYGYIDTEGHKITDA